MELLINKSDNNSVFLFDGQLGDKVWEAEPITRFRFKSPVENNIIKTLLKSNFPTAGIVFNDTPYIGTSDGMIYTPNNKIQRIPNLHVDTELFIDEYKFTDDREKELFKDFKKRGIGAINFKEDDIERIFRLDNLFNKISCQEDQIDNYLMGYLAIRGFVVSGCKHSEPEIKVYDGHMLGITETLSGKLVNDLPVLALYQLNKLDNRWVALAGFIPNRCPPIPMTKSVINEGIEKKIDVHCVDHRSLWDLTGQGVFIKDICPRDGSGYAPAKFATDGVNIGIYHGNHPHYSLDIINKLHGEQHKIKSIRLGSDQNIKKLLIHEGDVYGFYGETFRNFSSDEANSLTLMHHDITSLSDSGLFTIKGSMDNTTTIYDGFKKKSIATVPGVCVFLESAPQK